MGRAAEEGWAARSIVPAESSYLTLQASAVAVSALLDLEALSSSESGRQFRSGLQRGSTMTASSVSVSPVCVWGEHADPCFSFHRLSTFLHLKRKNRPWVRGSTWLPVTLSCGITTGQYHWYIEIKVHVLWSHALMEISVHIFSSSGHTQSPWCTAMRWYPRAPCVSFTLTWSSTGRQTKELTGRPWCLHSSRCGAFVIFLIQTYFHLADYFT